jgi:diguanylate cyclase (GGDEF)-like protein
MSDQPSRADSGTDGSLPPPSPDELASRLDREHLRQLYATARLSQAGVLVLGVSAAVLAETHGHVRPLLLAAWLLGLVATVLLRLALARRFERARIHDADLRRWQQITAGATGASGVVWGLYAWLAPPFHGRLFEPVAALVAATVTGASLVLVTVRYRYYLSFSLPLFFLLTARLLLVPPRSYLLAGMVAVVFVVLVAAANRARRILGNVAFQSEYNAHLVRALRRQSDLLSRERDRLGRLFESVPAPVAYCDARLMLRRHNRSFRATFPSPGCPLLGRNLREILGPRRFRALETHIRRALAGESCVFETTLPSLGPDGRKRRTFRISLEPDRAGEEDAGFYLHLVDVTSYKATEAQLADAAHHDSLTGLYNRRGFETVLATHLSRDADVVHGLIYLDLDRLKEINDRFGHETGDAALRTFAERLEQSVRADDCCARLGGDEFAVLLRNCPPECVVRVAESIRRVLAKPFVQGEAIVPLEASIGGVSFLPRRTTVPQAIAAADRCMYASKHERRLILKDLS